MCRQNVVKLNQIFNARGAAWCVDVLRTIKGRIVNLSPFNLLTYSTVAMHLRTAILPLSFSLSICFSRSCLRFCVNLRCTTTRWKYTVTLMMNIFDLRYTLWERDKNDFVSRSFYVGARHSHSLPVAHEKKKTEITLTSPAHARLPICFFPRRPETKWKIVGMCAILVLVSLASAVAIRKWKLCVHCAKANCEHGTRVLASAFEWIVFLYFKLIVCIRGRAQQVCSSFSYQFLHRFDSNVSIYFLHCSLCSCCMQTAQSKVSQSRHTHTHTTHLKATKLFKHNNVSLCQHHVDNVG